MPKYVYASDGALKGKTVSYEEFAKAALAANPGLQGKSPEEIVTLATQSHPDAYMVVAEPPSFGQKVSQNLIPSMQRYTEGVVQGLRHPIQSGVAVVSALSGTDTPIYDESAGMYRVYHGKTIQQGLVDHYAKRIQHPIDSFAEDPAGMAADVSAVATPLLRLGSAGTNALKASTVARVAASAPSVAKYAPAVSRYMDAAAQGMSTASEASRYLDMMNAVGGATVHLGGRAMPSLSRFAHDTLLHPAPGMDADTMNAARGAAFEYGVNPSHEGLKTGSDILTKASKQRRVAAEVLEANPHIPPEAKSVPIQQIFTPSQPLADWVNTISGGRVRLKSMEQMWGDAKTGQGAATRNGIVEAGNNFLADNAPGHGLNPNAPVRKNTFGATEFSGTPDEHLQIHQEVLVRKDPKTGKEIYTTHPADPRLFATELNENRMAANRQKKMFDDAAQGKLESIDTKGKASEATFKAIADNSRNLEYELLDRSGIQPPKMEGVNSWWDLAARDKKVGDAIEMAAHTMNSLNAKGFWGRGNAGPYYLASTLSAGGLLAQGHIPPVLTTTVAMMFLGSALTKSYPNKASEIFRALGKQHLSPEQWKMVGEAARYGGLQGRAYNEVKRIAEENGAKLESGEPPRPKAGQSVDVSGSLKMREGDIGESPFK